MPHQVSVTVYTLEELKERSTQDRSHRKAYERALDHVGQISLFDDWWTNMISKEEDGAWFFALDEIGFSDPEILFTGFGSQGDGASFSSRVNISSLILYLSSPPEPSESIPFATDGHEVFHGWIDHKIGRKYHQPKYERLIPVETQGHLAANVVRDSSRYVHEHTCSIEWDCSLPGRVNDDLGRDPRYPRTEALINEFFEDVERLRVDLCKAIYEDLKQEYFYLTSEPALLDSAEANGWMFDGRGEFFTGDSDA